MPGCNSYSNGSGAPIQFAAATLPDGFCFSGNWQDLFNSFAAILAATLPGSYAGFTVGDATPAVADRDKVWFRSTSGCAPLGMFVFYNGKWQRAIPHHLPPGAIIDYWDPTFHATDHAVNARKITYLDVYDETYSGAADAVNPFWRVCDGTNGTPDLRGRVRVGAGNNPDVAISDRLWGSTVGAESHTLTVSELPTISVETGASGGTGTLIQGKSPATGSLNINSGGNGHNNMQPSLCVYPIMRTSRTT